jgi:predicted nuclease of predicted toxin-antitoxin system
VRLLLDESLPRPLTDLLVGHDVQTVTQMGWTSLGNGALLRQAAAEFDALLTADQNVEFQQNLTTLPMSVIVLVATSNRLESLEPLVPDVLKVLETLQPKVLVRVGA